MSDIVDRLRCYARDDHERGCNGRYYDCSCGYDGKRDPLLEEAADEIERLRAALKKIAKVTYGSDWTWGSEELADYYSMRFFNAQETARAALGEEKKG